MERSSSASLLEHMGAVFEQHYGFFVEREIDWASAVAGAVAEAEDAGTADDGSIFTSLANLLEITKDAHVMLVGGKGDSLQYCAQPPIPAVIAGAFGKDTKWPDGVASNAVERFAASDAACNTAKAASVKLVRDRYLLAPPSRGDSSALPNEVLLWGWLPEGGSRSAPAPASGVPPPLRRVGYLMISSMSLDGYEFMPGAEVAPLLPNDFPPNPDPPLPRPTLDPLDPPSMAATLAVGLDRAAVGLQGASKIVVDVRFNDGGWDLFGLQIASRFNSSSSSNNNTNHPAATQQPDVGKRLLAGTKHRRERGVARGDPTQIWLEPFRGDPLLAFNAKEVDVLISKATCSAAEVFALAMRELPHVRLVGEATCGTLSDEMIHRLPNGWRYSLSNELYLSPRGECFEAAGVQPDLEVSHGWGVGGGGGALLEYDRILEAALSTELVRE